MKKARRAKQKQPDYLCTLAQLEKWIESNRNQILTWVSTSQLASLLHKIPSDISSYVCDIDNGLARGILALSKKQPKIGPSMDRLLGEEWSLALARANEWLVVATNIEQSINGFSTIARFQQQGGFIGKTSPELIKDLESALALVTTYAETLR